jgi:HPt (histidine-containing phosphotransfer) domain-containing protein
VDSHSVHALPVTNSEVALQRLGGDTSLYATLLTYFIQDAPGLMQKLRDAHREGKKDVFVHTVHGLKGLAATFEAVPFVSVAREIESAARAGDSTTVQTLLPQLDAEFDRLLKEVQTLAQ